MRRLHRLEVRRRHHHHIRPRRLTGTNTHCRILEHQAILNRNAQTLRPQHITGWIRLTQRNILCRHHHRRRCNARRLQPAQRQLLGADVTNAH